MSHPVIVRRLGKKKGMDSAVSDWARRVVANGGVFPSQATLTALQTFSRTISGLRSRIYHLNFVAPDHIIAFRTPFIVGTGFDPWQRRTINSPAPDTDGLADILTPTGWQGYQGSSPSQGYVYDTGVKPSDISAFTTGNAGMSVYAHIPNSSSPMIAGCYSAAGDPQFGIVPWQTTTNNANLYSYTLARVIVITSGTFTATTAHRSGFYLGSLSSTTRADLYFANSGNAWASQGNDTGVHSTSPPSDSSVAVGCAHQGGTYAPQHTSEISFFALHDGFSSADGQFLFNAVQALRVSLGTGYT